MDVDGTFLDLVGENFSDSDCARLESEYRFYWFLRIATEPGGLAFTRIWKYIYTMHDEHMIDALAFYGAP